MMPSAIVAMGTTQSNGCLFVTFPWAKVKKHKTRDREAKGNAGLLERHFLNLRARE